MSKTLVKALQLLKLFSEDKPYWKLDEISQATDLPKSTAFRLIKTLEEEGFIQKVNVFQRGVLIEGKIYQLGTRFIEYGSLVADQMEIRGIAFPYMYELQKQLDESVQLVIMDQNEAIYIEKVESNKPVRLYTKVGRRAPLYAGACPRSILSFLPDEEIERILEAPKQQYAKRTVMDNDAIWHSIHETRRKGYCYSCSELADGTAAIGTPIFGRYGDIAAGLSIAGFESMLTEESAMDYVPHMWEVCEKISKQLGYAQPYKYSLKE